ncbi:MAG: cyclic nucleotide-binding domain-containing protein [Cyanobacteria bacterium SID2]|nr:cyclic nucleotide-binding domain-containing protein [Cyanobacteria bacterium SID2]MBP0005736.1 cyclic nucleotide-binding domain-containing protein [Cyanobacteria bacterium SBC]
MSELLVRNAFWAGIISACSMPLGSLTSLFWHPRNRILAFLMAFGGGALLAALVIDLVGSATEKGHLLELVIGTISGSIVFTLTNQIINNSGGFLRKPSTTLLHLTQKEARRFEQRVSRFKRIDLFRDLEKSLRQKLVQFLLVTQYPKDAIIYRKGDPSESLYIIERGGVELRDPQAGFHPLACLSSNDTFGKMSFLTGCPHQTIAVATEDTKLEILTRSDFESMLQISERLAQNMASFLQGEDVTHYLQHRHGLSLRQAKDWVALAVQSLHQKGIIPAAVEITHKPHEFLSLALQIRRFPIFKNLSPDELEEIADRLIYRQQEDGFVFFQPKEFSDRLYIIHEGEVEIVYPKSLQKMPIVLESGDVFGELSFITGAAHTVTAIAKTDVKVWVFKKQYFVEMLQQSRTLEDNVRDFLERPKVKDYLQTRQNFEPTKAGQWVQKALETMNASHLIPSATAMAGAVEEHKNAPMAIWLGLLMDGIPEALTIGAHLAVAPLSPSLLAGLFIANYPEAFSSSQGMKQQGFSIPRIFFMWFSIMLVTGILSALGTVLFSDVPDSAISLLGSIAAGAMLTVISETMLPEAYAKGGSIVGISTILGFLVIILIRSSAPY